MSSTVVYDPSGAVTGGLPLDRDPHLALAAAVLAWGPNPAGVRAADCAQIGLQLTGHAGCVAADVRQRFEALTADRADCSRQASGPGRSAVNPVDVEECRVSGAAGMWRRPPRTIRNCLSHAHDIRAQ